MINLSDDILVRKPIQIRLLIFQLFLFTILPLNAQEFLHDNFGRALIPEIIELPDEGVIPEKVYFENDSRSIGESIVFRVSQNRTTSKYSAVPFNAANEAQLHFYFSFQDIKPEDIARRGIINIFQVTKKDPYNTRGARMVRHLRTANILSGLVIKETKDTINETNVVRPKYVGLDINMGKELNFKTDGLDYFGEVVAVLKQEVMLRATYTAFDSGAFAQGYPGAKREVRPLTESFIYAPRGGTSQYFEGQIWGELDLRDIKEFLVPPNIKQSNLKKLRELGLPIYQYIELREFGRYRRVRDILIYEGDPLKQRSLNLSLQQSRKIMNKTLSCIAFYSGNK